MAEISSQYNGVEIFFLICALVGGVFVILKFILQLIGMDHGVATDADIGGHNFDAHHADSDFGFKLLSIHSITCFLMMFGLVGLSLYRQSQAGIFLSLVGAIIPNSAS